MDRLDVWISSLASRLQPIKLYGAGDPTLAEIFPTFSVPLPASWLAALSGDADPGDVVEQIWSPLHERARGWVTRLAMITSGFGLAVGVNNSATPRLVYLSRWGGEVHGWLAGLPAGDPAIAACEQRLDRALPSSLRRFAEIHAGLLENGVANVGFCGPADLDLLPGHPELLPFFGDGYGDRQCFDLSASVGHGDYPTVTWDHALDITRRPQSFWSFLKELTVRGFG